MTDPKGTGDAALATPRVAVIAVTFRGDDVILVRRGKEPQKGTWGFPGGSVEPGECLREAAARELFEETGVRAEVGEPFDVVEVIGFDPHGRHHHYVLVAMLCRHVEGALRPGDDATDCRWVRVPADLSRFPGALADHVARVAQRAHALNHPNRKENSR